MTDKSIDQKPLRRDQVEHFERLAARLAALSDDELDTLREEWAERIRPRLLSASPDAPLSELDPVLLVEMATADMLGDEVNYRLGVIWEAESDMQGGHRVHVTKDDATLGTWRAKCAPRWDYTAGEPTCWEGPERSHIEDAMEDARRHHPGHEPWWIEREPPG